MELLKKCTFICDVESKKYMLCYKVFVAVNGKIINSVKTLIAKWKP